jgi:hypothetical protein
LPGTLPPAAAGARLPPASREEARALHFEPLQQRAVQQGVALRSPPPEPLTCCGRGCNRPAAHAVALDW